MSHHLYNTHAFGNQRSTWEQCKLLSPEVDEDPQRPPYFTEPNSRLGFCRDSVKSSVTRKMLPSFPPHSVSYRPERSRSTFDQVTEGDIDLCVNRQREEMNVQPRGQDVNISSSHREVGKIYTMASDSSPARHLDRYPDAESSSSSLAWLEDIKQATANCLTLVSSSESSKYAGDTDKMKVCSEKESHISHSWQQNHFFADEQSTPFKIRQSRYNSEIASKILLNFGLEKEDLEYFVAFPEDQITPDNLPFILHYISVEKAKRNTHTVESKTFEESKIDQRTEGVDYGHSNKYADRLVDETLKTTYTRSPSGTSMAMMDASGCTNRNKLMVDNVTIPNISSSSKLPSLPPPSHKLLSRFGAQPLQTSQIIPGSITLPKKNTGGRVHSSEALRPSFDFVYPGSQPRQHNFMMSDSNCVKDIKNQGHTQAKGSRLPQQKKVQKTQTLEMVQMGHTIERPFLSARKPVSSASAQQPIPLDIVTPSIEVPKPGVKRISTSTMSSADPVVGPKQDPQRCSLCKIDSVNLKDWLTHLTSSVHQENCRLFQEANDRTSSISLAQISREGYRRDGNDNASLSHSANQLHLRGDGIKNHSNRSPQTSRYNYRSRSRSHSPRNDSPHCDLSCSRSEKRLPGESQSRSRERLSGELHSWNQERPSGELHSWNQERPSGELRSWNQERPSGESRSRNQKRLSGESRSRSRERPSQSLCSRSYESSSQRGFDSKFPQSLSRSSEKYSHSRSKESQSSQGRSQVKPLSQIKLSNQQKKLSSADRLSQKLQNTSAKKWQTTVPSSKKKLVMNETKKSSSSKTECTENTPSVQTEAQDPHTSKESAKPVKASPKIPQKKEEGSPTEAAVESNKSVLLAKMKPSSSLGSSSATAKKQQTTAPSSEKKLVMNETKKNSSSKTECTENTPSVQTEAQDPHTSKESAKPVKASPKVPQKKEEGSPTKAAVESNKRVLLAKMKPSSSPGSSSSTAKKQQTTALSSEKKLVINETKKNSSSKTECTENTPSVPTEAPDPQTSKESANPVKASGKVPQKKEEGSPAPAAVESNKKALPPVLLAKIKPSSSPGSSSSTASKKETTVQSSNKKAVMNDTKKSNLPKTEPHPHFQCTGNTPSAQTTASARTRRRRNKRERQRKRALVLQMNQPKLTKAAVSKNQKGSVKAEQMKVNATCGEKSKIRSLLSIVFEPAVKNFQSSAAAGLCNVNTSLKFSSVKGNVACVTGLPKYYEGCYTEEDVATILKPFGFEHKHNTIYVLPQSSMAFFVMPSSCEMNNLITSIKKCALLFKGSQLALKPVNHAVNLPPLQFYKMMMEMNAYPLADSNESIVYVRDISPSEIKHLTEALQSIGSVVNLLPLLNKVFIQFQSPEDADRIGVWANLLKTTPSYKITRLKIPDTSDSVTCPVSADKALPNAAEAACGATVPQRVTFLPPGTVSPFWITLRASPYIFPTVSPWFIIPRVWPINAAGDIKGVLCRTKCHDRRSNLRTVMITGLPEENYTHKDFAKLFWLYFSKRTLRTLYYNVIVLALQRRAFLHFHGWSECLRFLWAHVTCPQCFHFMKLGVHLILQPMSPCSSEEMMYQSMMKLSSLPLSNPDTLEERLLCVEISEMTLDTVIYVMKVVGSIAPVASFIPLANRICIEMADSRSVSQVLIRTRSHEPPPPMTSHWSKVGSFVTMKGLKRHFERYSGVRIQLHNLPTIQEDENYESQQREDVEKTTVDAKNSDEKPTGDEAENVKVSCSLDDPTGEQMGDNVQQTGPQNSTMSHEESHQISDSVTEKAKSDLKGDDKTELRPSSHVPDLVTKDQVSIIKKGGDLVKDDEITGKALSEKKEVDKSDINSTTEETNKSEDTTEEQSSQDPVTEDQITISQKHSNPVKDNKVTSEETNKSEDTTEEQLSQDPVTEDQITISQKDSNLVKDDQVTSGETNKSEDTTEEQSSQDPVTEDQIIITQKDSNLVKDDKVTSGETNKSEDTTEELKKRRTEEKIIIGQKDGNLVKEDQVTSKETECEDTTKDISYHQEVPNEDGQKRKSTKKGGATLRSEDAPEKRNIPATRAASRSEGKSPTKQESVIKKYATRRNKDTTGGAPTTDTELINVSEHTVPPPDEDEPVPDTVTVEGPARRRSARRNKEEKLTLTLTEASNKRDGNKEGTCQTVESMNVPTRKTRSGRGRTETTAKTDASTENVKTVQEDTPTTTVHTASDSQERNEATPKEGNEVTQQVTETNSDVNVPEMIKDQGPAQISDCLEDEGVKDDPPAPRRRRGIPKKNVKVSKTDQTKSNNGSDPPENVQFLESVEPQTASDVTPTDERKDDVSPNCGELTKISDSITGPPKNKEDEVETVCQIDKSIEDYDNHKELAMTEESDKTKNEILKNDLEQLNTSESISGSPKNKEQEESVCQTESSVQDDHKVFAVTEESDGGRTTEQSKVRVSPNPPTERVRLLVTEEERPLQTTLEPRPLNQTDSLVGSSHPEMFITLNEVTSEADNEAGKLKHKDDYMDEGVNFAEEAPLAEEKKEVKIRAKGRTKKRTRLTPAVCKQEGSEPDAKRPRSQSSCVSAEPFKPGTLFGEEFLVPTLGLFCNICSVFCMNESTASQSHCSSQMHYDNLQKHYQNLQQTVPKP
ncbi:zinc finger protein 638-like isoform X2 [Thalassophryne amazonica]|uniref:zinc finger protein 638-like isoform X2 n=1 Tax=Thalassophryne amazonica TaxID=390379 RepID=UPI0014715214|nr:zinc finger protein 638-like isoform X2 [Thalassophryne amazonica]